MIAHPPCTFLANSSAKHLYLGMKKENGPNQERLNRLHDGALFFKLLWDQQHIPRICVENPIMLSIAKTIIKCGKQTQIIQPWQHGHGETKASCLWLKGLEPLRPSHVVSGREQRIHKLPPSPDRWKIRSTTFPGIAKAFAEQWV